MRFLKIVKKVFDKVPKIILVLLLILFLLVAGGFLVVTLNLPINEAVENIAGNTTSKFQPLLYQVSLTPTRVPTLTPTITPTPTLSPKQILDSMNQKYGSCRYVPVLMYHHLLSLSEAKKINASWLSVSPEIFDQQMSYLQQKGYQTIFLGQLISGLNNNSLPAKPVVITFDDGYRELYDNLLPILKKYNFKASLFLISQFLGGERYLDWWQVRLMRESGLVEIGDHTLNHPSLIKDGEAEERNQILGAKNILEQNLGQMINVFAYPYGGYNQTSEKILKEGGFVAAVTTKRGNPVCVGLPYEISRIRIGGALLSAYGL